MINFVMISTKVGYKCSDNYYFYTIRLNFLKSLFIIIFIFINLLSFGQSKGDELTGGVIIHTRSGFIGGFSGKYSQRMNRNWSNFYSLDIANIRSTKEIRIPSTSSGTFILGKSNFLFSIRPQIGMERLLFTKDPDQGVKVSFAGAVGPSVGIVKPYIVEYKTPAGQIVKEQYTEDVDLNAIIGNAGWFRGIGQSKIAVGGNIKSSLIFEYGTAKNRISAVETGFIFEQYGAKVQLNPFVKGESSFLMAFVTLSFGKKL